MFFFTVVEKSRFSRKVTNKTYYKTSSLFIRNGYAHKSVLIAFISLREESETN